MANNKLVINTAEFIAALRQLPRDLGLEGAEILHREVNAAATEIRDAYPVGPEGSPQSNSGRPPGGLKRGVTVKEIARNEFGAVYKLRSAAPHAHLWEYGSELRTADNGGSRGRMPEPPHPVFVPIVVRHREAIQRALIALVERAGLRVTGKAA